MWKREKMWEKCWKGLSNLKAKKVNVLLIFHHFACLFEFFGNISGVCQKIEWVPLLSIVASQGQAINDW